MTKSLQTLAAKMFWKVRDGRGARAGGTGDGNDGVAFGHKGLQPREM